MYTFKYFTYFFKVKQSSEKAIARMNAIVFQKEFVFNTCIYILKIYPYSVLKASHKIQKWECQKL